MKRAYGYPTPKKSLGQVMLVDAAVAGEIVDSLSLNEMGRVLEIGPGRGILTKYLLQTGAQVTCCEIDRRMGELLNRRFEALPNFRLLLGDILELNLNEIFPGEIFQAIGNLPYHLTSGILFKFYDFVKGAWDCGESLRVESLTVMLQKEVAERLVSQPGGRNWGVLSVFNSLYGETERVLEVPADCFKPKPQVDSTVVRLVFRKSYPFEIKDYNLFRTLVKTTFNQRRKMLRNTLKQFAIPDDVGIDLRKRPEELTAADFAALANAVEENGHQSSVSGH